MTRVSRAQSFVFLGAVFAGLAVAAGAFGAHALKGILDAPMLVVFETATRYQMYHAIGLCIVAWTDDRYPEKRVWQAGWFFVFGILLFSGSLYGVSLTGVKWFGALTPIGGVAFLVGWLLLAYRMWEKTEGKS